MTTTTQGAAPAAPAPESAAPFVCPECGSRRFRAEYYQAVHQGVTLVMGPDDRVPEPDDFLGDEESFDDGTTADEAYACTNAECSYRIVVASFRYRAFTRPRIQRVR